MTDLPAAAIKAAFAASPFANQDAVRHALEAAAPHITAAATAAEREKIRAAIEDEYGPSEARKMRRVLLGDAT